MLPKFFQATFSAIRPSKFFVIKTGENAAQIFARLFLVIRLSKFLSSKQGKMLPKFVQAKFSAIRLSNCFVIKKGKMLPKCFQEYFLVIRLSTFPLQNRGNWCPNFCLAKFSAIRLAKLCHLNRGKILPQFFPRLFFSDSTFHFSLWSRAKCCSISARSFLTFRFFLGSGIKQGENVAQFWQEYFMAIWSCHLSSKQGKMLPNSSKEIFRHLTFQVRHENRGKCCPIFPGRLFGHVAWFWPPKQGKVAQSFLRIFFGNSIY